MTVTDLARPCPCLRSAARCSLFSTGLKADGEEI